MMRARAIAEKAPPSEANKPGLLDGAGGGGNASTVSTVTGVIGTGIDGRMISMTRIGFVAVGGQLPRSSFVSGTDWISAWATLSSGTVV